jgi:hypothetical protein
MLLVRQAGEIDVSCCGVLYVGTRAAIALRHCARPTLKVIVVLARPSWHCEKEGNKCSVGESDIHVPRCRREWQQQTSAAGKEAGE